MTNNDVMRDRPFGIVFSSGANNTNRAGMLSYSTISIGLLSAAIAFLFFGAYFGLPLAPYLSTLAILISLYLYKNITPLLFLSVLVIAFFLFLLAPSPFFLGALIPLLGFLFSGDPKRRLNGNEISRYILAITCCLLYAIYLAAGFTYLEGGASHNQLSVFLAYALLAEYLYFGSVSRLYLPLILVSFLVFGNRSSLFLLLGFVRSKVIIGLLVSAGVVFMLFTYDVVTPPQEIKPLFELGGLFYRSTRETRGDYIEEFFQAFNFFDLQYDRWRFYDVPSTVGGFYDLHNSFLTVIVRDAYLGLFKVFLWILQIGFLPLGIFTAVSLRAFNDTFLLGGVVDVLVFSLVGTSIRNAFLGRQKHAISSS